MQALRPHLASGAVRMLQHTQVLAADWESQQQHWQLHLDSPEYEAGSSRGQAADMGAHTLPSSSKHACSSNVEDYEDAAVLHAERVWLATGSMLDASKDILLHALQLHCPTQLASGLPVLTQHLQWRSDVEVYVIGAYAALALGPGALNLMGARTAALRLVGQWRAESQTRGSTGIGGPGSAAGMGQAAGHAESAAEAEEQLPLWLQRPMTYSKYASAGDVYLPAQRRMLRHHQHRSVPMQQQQQVATRNLSSAHSAGSSSGTVYGEPERSHSLQASATGSVDVSTAASNGVAGSSHTSSRSGKKAGSGSQPWMPSPGTWLHGWYTALHGHVCS